MQTRYVNMTGVSALLAVCASVNAQSYSVTLLGGDVRYACAFALNNSGDVAGYQINDNWSYRGTVWDGSLLEIDPVGSDTQTQAFDINDAGQAIATSHALGQMQPHAVLNAGGVGTDLGAFTPTAINAGGVVVGSTTVTVPSGLSLGQACVWNGALNILEQFDPSDTSIAQAISDDGWIVGSSQGGSGLRPRAALWIASTPSDLGTLGGTSSQALDINNAHQVVGVADTAGGQPHAFLFQLNGSGAVTTRTDLGALGSLSSYAYAINEAGDVVGTSDDRAFLYSGGAMQDLNALISPSSDWYLTIATDINEAGQISGWGLYQGELHRAFLLTPAPACAADMNGDGLFNGVDVGLFLSLYSTGCA